MEIVFCYKRKTHLEHMAQKLLFLCVARIISVRIVTRVCSLCFLSLSPQVPALRVSTLQSNSTLWTLANSSLSSPGKIIHQVPHRFLMQSVPDSLKKWKQRTTDLEFHIDKRGVDRHEITTWFPSIYFQFSIIIVMCQTMGETNIFYSC